MSRIHELKVWPEFFEATKRGDKRFEFRRNDRGFAVGDFLHLREWDPQTEDYTGGEIILRVRYLLQGGVVGIPEGYCLMSLDTVWPGDLFALLRAGGICAP